MEKITMKPMGCALWRFFCYRQRFTLRAPPMKLSFGISRSAMDSATANAWNIALGKWDERYKKAMAPYDDGEISYWIGSLSPKAILLRCHIRA